MDLSQLKFAVDTTELDRAGVAIGNLVTNVGKLDKASKDVARTEATLAKAAKDNAAANLTTAKAQEVTAKATEKTNSILQRQTDIYDFMTQGFSKGQSRTLATAKATGQLSDELKRVLEDMKAFSNDSFDKSELGLKRLQKTMKETVAAQGYFNEGSNLTTKQARELSNDLDRIGVSLKRQGKSYQEVTQAQALHKQQFIEEAAAVNRAQNALDVVTKQRKEVVTATNYLTQAEQKMAAALNTSNAALDKAGTDSLVKYETALRKSGLSQDIATQKLAKYKVQLAQVQAEEMKRREQHLTRAVAPQATDIVVSLWSGQSPLTVLLQQGGQLTDMFMLSGVAADKFGEVVKKSMKSMLPSILTVAKGVGGLIVDGFVAAGSKVQNFLADIFHLNGAMNKLYEVMSADGPSKWGGWIRNASAILTGTFAVGIAVVTAGLVALAVGLKQVTTENNDLAKAFALSGASIGLSHAQIIGYVKTLANSGATTGQATEALVAMAKAGTFTSKEILLVSDSAIQMQKGFGVAIEDTVKQFAKLKEKPVEALLEIAKSSGMVGPEIIKMVQELERAGKTTDAASLAMKSYADVNRQRIGEMKEDYNGFALFLVELGQDIKQFFSDSFKALFLSTSPSRQLENQLSSVRDQIKEINTFGSFGRGDELKVLKEQERILQSRISATVRLQGEQDRIKLANAESARLEEATLKIRKNALDAIDKEAGKTQTLAEFRKSFVDEKLKEAAKEKSIDVEKLRLNTDLTKVLEQQADIEFKKNKKKDPSENYYATLMREATNNTIKADNATQGLTKSELKLLEVKSDPRFEKLTAAQRSEVTAKYETAIAIERLVKVEKERAKLDEDALEAALKTIEKNDEIAKSYENAKVAAAEYLDTLRLQAAREKDGIGKGTAYRSDQSGLNGIENKFSTKKNSLAKSKVSLGDYWYEQELAAAQSTYDQEVAIYRQSVADKLAAQGDWTNGASEALANYLSETQNVAKSTEDMFSKAFKGMEDALVSFVKTGKLDFASLADSIITDLIRIQIQQSVMPGLSAGLNAGASWVASLFSANGNAFDTSGQVQKFAKGGTFTNQIVDQPTPFKFAKGTGIMGEAGPEAIMPLTRGSDGKLGVQASGSTSGNSIIVNVIESPGNGGQQSRRTENGVDILDVFVEKVKTSIATDINRGSGVVPNAMASTYGLNRVAGAY